MRVVSIVALAFAASIMGGCITISAEPTPAPSQAPTEIPMITPAPTPPPTQVPTEGPPTPTPDPAATPRPTAVDIAPYLTSEVTVVNLADAALSLTVALLDPDTDEEYVVGTFDVQPNQVTTQSVIPALFRLDFAYAGNVVGSCSVNIADGEQLQFAAIAAGIVMTTNGAEPEDPSEMLVATSSRCREDTTP